MNLKNSTYLKSILLASFSSAFFMLLFVALYLYTIREEKRDISLTSYDFKKEIESLLESSWSAYENQINDMSFWDEFVKYVSTKDKQWFDFYIATSIDVYQLDLVSVYDLQGNLVDAKIKGDFNKDIIPRELLNKLYKKKFLSFFIKNNNVIYKVYGSTIHPSNDPNRKLHSPAGYFFMALRLDKNYLEKIKKISSANHCFLMNKDETVQKENIEFLKTIYDWKGEDIGTFYFSKHTHRDFTTSKIILRVVILASILNLFLYLYYARKWFFTPLQLITKILETPDNGFEINSLKQIDGEFSHIGQLFEENDNQKDKLIEAKLEAERSNQLKSVFLANLSHEIRTPINAINGFSEILIHSQTTSNEKKEYLDIINRSGKNLVKIIDDLIEMSKIDSNLIKPNYSTFDLEKTIQELYESIKITIPPEKPIHFVLEKVDNNLKYDITTDEIKFKQIVINLVNNAIKFTKSGTVTLSCFLNKDEHKLTIKVSDTGIGIDNKHLDKIFERFGRVENELSIQVGGLGLGLSITKAYIEILKGNITINSEPNKGSTFEVTIPAVVDEIQSIKKPKNNPALSTNNQYTILVAEDDNINFFLFQKIIQNQNYNIIRATNGQEAVTICETHPDINLILMDIKMPLLSGYEAIKIIKTLRPNIPIIAQTAYASDEDKLHILREGFSDYISKPLDRNHLINLINKYLK